MSEKKLTYSSKQPFDFEQLKRELKITLILNYLEEHISSTMAGQSSGQYDTEPHHNNMSVTHQESDLPGRGSFLMLVEDDVKDDGDQTQSTNVDINSSDSKAKGSKVKCIIGLEDISPTTGNDKGGETHNLCELRRMAIHSSCRHSGYRYQASIYKNAYLMPRSCLRK